jgi:hypothetical protein
MSITATFKDLVDIVLVVPKLVPLNAELRQGIRDAVGSVADELTRDLSFVEARLEVAKVLARSSKASANAELQTYMAETRGKLFEVVSEFKICRGLRETRDRFTRPFDLAKASVRLENVHKIDGLLYELENDERLIIDEVGPILTELSAAASGPPASFIALTDSKIGLIRQRVEKLRQLAREVHESL